jgi:hypothetical protein
MISSTFSKEPRRFLFFNISKRERGSTDSPGM